MQLTKCSSTSCFDISEEDILPDELVSCVLLFAASQKGYQKIVDSEDFPSPQYDTTTCTLLKKVIEARLSQYSTTGLEEDRKVLIAPRSVRHKNATVVRLGEKELLHATLAHIDELRKEAKSKSSKKRGAEDSASARKRQKI